MGMNVTERTKSGPKGTASVRVLPKIVKVTLDNQVYEIDKDNAPAHVFTTDEAFVSLSGDKSKMYGFAPVEGNFFLKFRGFTKDQQENPATYVREPETRPGKGGKGSWVTPRRLCFTALLEVQGSEFDGATVRKTLDYNFTPDESGRNTNIDGDAYHVRILTEFLRLAGFDFVSDSIDAGEAAEVILGLESVLLEKDAVFMGSIKNGYANELSSPPKGVAIPKKKVSRAKKAVKKVR
mgnify:CR=1 FL=1